MTSSMTVGDVMVGKMIDQWRQLFAGLRLLPRQHRDDVLRAIADDVTDLKEIKRTPHHGSFE